MNNEAVTEYLLATVLVIVYKKYDLYWNLRANNIFSIFLPLLFATEYKICPKFTKSSIPWGITRLIKVMSGLAFWTILLSRKHKLYIANILGSTKFHQQTKLLPCIVLSKEFGFTVLTWPGESREVKVGSLRFPLPPKIHNWYTGFLSSPWTWHIAAL